MYKLDQKVDDQTYQNLQDAINKEKQDAFYKLPVKDTAQPSNTYNCATFFGTCGLNLPEETGNLDNYIPAMIEKGAGKVN